MSHNSRHICIYIKFYFTSSRPWKWGQGDFVISTPHFSSHFMYIHDHDDDGDLGSSHIFNSFTYFTLCLFYSINCLCWLQTVEYKIKLYGSPCIHFIFLIMPAAQNTKTGQNIRTSVCVQHNRVPYPTKASFDQLDNVVDCWLKSIKKGMVSVVWSVGIHNIHFI